MKLNLLLPLGLLVACSCVASAQQIAMLPQSNSKNVNPDAHLVLTFTETPKLGTSGKIRIYDAASHKLVDSLDLSIPAGPTVRNTARAEFSPRPYDYAPGHFTNANTKPGTPSGMAAPTTGNYQLTIIGGFTDGFHFYPVIIHDNVATMYPHNNLLEYNKSYYVTIDPQVFITANGFKGISPNAWAFSTKKAGPKSASKLLVNADGSGDFNTVQGALDYVPENNKKPVTILVKNGTYEEIVYFRKKSNITLIGEDREKTLIIYNNFETFNPHPVNLSTNEMPGTFPSRRATFMADNCTDINIANMSIKNPSNQQSEGLLITGERNMLYHVNVRGGGDALQVNGSNYFKDSKIEGLGDMILGRGANFFDGCDLYSRGSFMWIRNTDANHGNVFVNSNFHGNGPKPTDLAHEPVNNNKTYPYSEAVLINCGLEGIIPEGWSQIEGDTQNIHYWEYNSHNIADGKPIDVSKRHPVSKQLTMAKDAATIANYSTPAFVLGGWIPLINNFIKEVNSVLATK